jgi:hypothetical protein
MVLPSDLLRHLSGGAVEVYTKFFSGKKLLHSVVFTDIVAFDVLYNPWCLVLVS